MLPKHWGWRFTQRFPLFFRVSYWLGITYFLVMAVAFSLAAVATQSWIIVAAAITAIAFFPLNWYFEVFRCLVCGEQCSRRQLLHQGERHGA
jgi:membrane protein YdbS with pleckstrin-like domain